MWAFLLQAEQAQLPEDRGVYERLVQALTSDASPHSNCGRSFRRLFEQDRAEAALAVDVLVAVGVPDELGRRAPDLVVRDPDRGQPEVRDRRRGLGRTLGKARGTGPPTGPALLRH